MHTIARGHYVDALVTVDPVRHLFRLNFHKVAKCTGRWANNDSFGTGLVGGGSFWAIVGRAYNNAPQRMRLSIHM